MVPNRRYSAIGFHQPTSGLASPTIAATSPLGPRLGVMGPAEAPGLASDIGTGPSSSSELASIGEPLGGHAVVSSSSRIEGLNKSCMNTPGWGGSQFDLS
jgi:hypothetical protein